MKLVVAVVAVAIISTDALAEVGIEHVVKAVPSAAEPESLLPERCEFLEVRDGVKLWRGDCVSASPHAKFIAPKKQSWRQKSRLAKKSVQKLSLAKKSVSNTPTRRPCCTRAARYIGGR